MPQIFGWQHFTYLGIFLLVSAATLACIKIKVKRDFTLTVLTKCLGVFLFAMIAWNRITIALAQDNALMLIPNSFCGMTSLCLALCAIFCKRDALVFHCFVYLALWGGTLTLIYPDFISQDARFFYPPTISGLLHHSVALYVAVMLILTGQVKPSVRKFYAFPVGMCLLLCYGLFLIDALGFSGAMYIGSPLIEGTILTWYFVGPLMIIVTFAILCGCLYAVKAVAKRRDSRLNG